MDNIHYVKEQDNLVPAGMTEFARDKTSATNPPTLQNMWRKKQKESTIKRTVSPFPWTS